MLDEETNPASNGIASAPGALPMPMIKERSALKASQFRHDNTISPTAPTPDQVVTITATSGAILPLERVEIWYSIDGSQPGSTSFRLPMTLHVVNWQPETSYVNHWQGQIPAQADGTIVRYQIVGYSASATDIPDHVAFDGSGFWYRYAEEGMTVFAYRVRSRPRDLPAWMDDAIIYHIFLDRFHNGRSDGNWPAGLEPMAKHGGNLQGVIEALPYLEELGVNCLWLSPVGPSATYHRYDQTSFFAVGEDLGGLATLRKLVTAAQKRGIRLILDFVPSHGSWKMPEFLAAQADQNAATASWFVFEEWPDKYRSFLGMVPTLVSFNSNDPGLRNFLIESAKYWLCDVGFDGLRLDHSIGHGLDFWVQFCSELEAVKPDVALFGEATDTVDNLLRQGGRLQGLLDFPLAAALRLTFGSGLWGVAELAGFLRSYTAYMKDGPGRVSFLDNHDMDRFLFVAGNDKRRLQLAALCLFTLPYPPSLYYGTEIGVTQLQGQHSAGYGGDHLIRADMPWDEGQWDHTLLSFFKELITLRKQHPLLRTGKWLPLLLDEPRQLMGYRLVDDVSELRVYFNLSEQTQALVGETGRSLLSISNNSNLNYLEPFEGKLVQANK